MVLVVVHGVVVRLLSAPTIKATFGSSDKLFYTPTLVVSLHHRSFSPVLALFCSGFAVENLHYCHCLLWICRCSTSRGEHALCSGRLWWVTITVKKEEFRFLVFHFFIRFKFILSNVFLF